jgi:hypothetical protein
VRASMIPSEQFPGCGIEFGSIEIAEQRRRGEASGTQVEDEVHKGVELALVQRDFDEALDSGLGDGKVVAKDGFALREGDAVRVGFGRGEAVAEADGAEAGYVGVDAVAESFGFFKQVQACRTQVHWISPYPKEKAAHGGLRRFMVY